MDLGATDKVRPLVSAVRAMVRDEIMPIEGEYEAEIGREGASSLHDSESQWGFHYLREIHHGDSERYRGPEGQKLFHVSPPS